MKKIAVLLIFGVFLFVSGCAATYAVKSSRASKIEKGEKLYSKEIQIKKSPEKLSLGETLTYQVKWLGVPVGEIIASVAPKLEQVNGRSAYKVSVIAKTNNFCSAIYKVEDKFISYIDTETMTTLRHEVYRRDGRYKKDAITDFDQTAHTAHFKNLINKEEKTFTIPEKTQDTLSACYYFRILELKLGDRVEYSVVNNEKNYTLFGIIEDKKFISIKGLGEFESFFIQPYARVLGGEQVKKGKVSGYFSADEKRLPLLAIVEAPVFTKVTVTLAKVECVGAASGRE